MTLRTAAPLIVLVGIAVLFQAQSSRSGESGPGSADPTNTTPVGTAPQLAPPITALAPDLDRNPVAVALSPDGTLALTANSAAHTVSLIDLKSRAVTAEVVCGRGPVDLVWLDAAHALVSLLQDDSVAFLKIRPGAIEVTAHLPVGHEPRGLALWRPATGDQPAAASEGPTAVSPTDSPAGPIDETQSARGPFTRAFVAVSGGDCVAVIDLAEQKIVERISVGAHPRTVAVSPNGQWLMTACSSSGDLYVHDIATGKQLSRRTIFDQAANLGTMAVLPDSGNVVIPHIVNRSFPVTDGNIEQGWVIDNRLTSLPLPNGEYWKQSQLGLDVRGDAVGDAHAVALSPDGRWLIVTCGGSHELLIFVRGNVPWPPGGSGDFLPYELLDDDGDFRRLELGGRPLGVSFLDARTAVVANALLNAVQIIDVVEAKLVATIPLGGPDTPSLERRGEFIFYDADRSFNSWFSCHSCHFEGHTCSQTFDTLNDGNFDTYKNTPTLRGVTETGPWTWHGWQTELSASVLKSMRDTLHTDKPFTDEDSAALLAFLKTLAHPRNPNRTPGGGLTEAALRGQQLFATKGACHQCHGGPHFTSTQVVDVKTGSDRYLYDGFNPPSLIGVHARRRFLHDGRADTLEEVLKRYHQPEKVAGESLTDAELADLIAYLKSL